MSKKREGNFALSSDISKFRTISSPGHWLSGHLPWEHAESTFPCWPLLPSCRKGLTLISALCCLVAFRPTVTGQQWPAQARKSRRNEMPTDFWGTRSPFWAPLCQGLVGEGGHGVEVSAGPRAVRSSSRSWLSVRPRWLAGQRWRPHSPRTAGPGCPVSACQFRCPHGPSSSQLQGVIIGWPRSCPGPQHHRE